MDAAIWLPVRPNNAMQIRRIYQCRAERLAGAPVSAMYADVCRADVDGEQRTRGRRRRLAMLATRDRRRTTGDLLEAESRPPGHDSHSV